MATLITVTHPGGGNKTRTCDASCYEAKGIGSKACRCVCRGINHGVGPAKAYENTSVLKGDKAWLEHHKGKLIKFDERQFDLILEQG
jgi:hypothetical protein